MQSRGLAGRLTGRKVGGQAERERAGRQAAMKASRLQLTIVQRLYVLAIRMSHPAAGGRHTGGKVHGFPPLIPSRPAMQAHLAASHPAAHMHACDPPALATLAPSTSSDTPGG